MGIGRQRKDEAGLRHRAPRRARLQPCDQTFGLPHVQRVFDDAFGGETLLLLIREAENDFGVAHGNPTVAQVGPNDHRQLQ